MALIAFPDDVARLEVDGEGVIFWMWDTPALLARGRGDTVPLTLTMFPRYDRVPDYSEEELRELWRAKRGA